VNITTAWRTDEPCPTCGKDLTLLDDGDSPIRWECRFCGDAPDHPDTFPGGDW
jgi:ribosomal protein S27AE